MAWVFISESLVPSAPWESCGLMENETQRIFSIFNIEIYTICQLLHIDILVKFPFPRTSCQNFNHQKSLSFISVASFPSPALSTRRLNWLQVFIFLSKYFIYHIFFSNRYFLCPIFFYVIVMLRWSSKSQLVTAKRERSSLSRVFLSQNKLSYDVVLGHGWDVNIVPIWLNNRYCQFHLRINK